MRCPRCFSGEYRPHGSYVRKGFHSRAGGTTILLRVRRYECLNPACTRRTFSILPPQVMRYCRFFWPDLLAVKQSLAVGISAYRLARYVWQVGQGVIARAAALLEQVRVWMTRLHRELSDGATPLGLGLMVKFATDTLGRVELVSRWYAHHYPRRHL